MINARALPEARWPAWRTVGGKTLMNRLVICNVASGLGMLARGSISSVIVAVIQPNLPTTEETVADPGLGPQ